ncbi:hypothetical protein Rhopal_002858-T1 [Rhodotorula paludigena]|uniref:Uncharacterized protein n=1 Tax=Rhodotorula paludigena TaxID=86838 RepID=A0AAV5GKU6_9BASI|nr:hypothetical protein Rhopal_002858-T1 [Rhodotorula paludigena]
MFGDHLFVPGGPSNADLTEFLRTRVNSPLQSFVYDAVGDYGRRCKHMAEKLKDTDGREHWINYQSREGLCPSCDDLSANEDVWEIDSTTYEVPEPSRHPRQVYR